MKAIHTFKLSLRFLCTVVLTGCCLVLLGRIPLHAQAGADARDASPLQIVHADTDGIVVAFTVDQYEITSLARADGAYSSVTIPGTVLITEPGKPQAPTLGALFSVPTLANITVEVLDAEYNLLDNLRLPPAPQIEIGPGLESWNDSFLMDSFVTDAPIYNEDADYPNEIVTLVETGTMRDQPVAQVQFYPVQTNPVQGQTKLYHRIVARITWEPEETSFLAPSDKSSALFEQIHRDSLFNYRPASIASVQAATIQETVLDIPTQISITVNTPGVYKIDNATISQYLDDAEPLALTLRSLGKEVPLLIDDGAVLFYGEPLDSHYVEENVYWLRVEYPSMSIGARQVATITTPITTPITTLKHVATVEEDTAFWQNMRDKNLGKLCKPSEVDACHKDRWFWNGLLGPDGMANRAYPIGQGTAHIVADAEGQVDIKVYVRGYTRTHHRTIVRLVAEDGSILATSPAAQWFGQIERVIRLSASHTLMAVAREVEVLTESIVTDGVADQILVNRIEIGYTRQNRAPDGFLKFSATPGTPIGVEGFTQSEPIVLLDITSLGSPIQLQGFSDPDTNGQISFIDNLDGIQNERTYVAARPETIQKCSSNQSGEACFFPYTAWEEVAEDRNGEIVLRQDPQGDNPEYVVITHGKFMAAAAALAGRYTDKNAKVVSIDTIAKSFGYGIESPFAIKRFVKAAKEAWQTEYVVLMGDATLDYRENFDATTQNHGVNYVPTFSFESSYFGEIASDNWYGQLDSDARPNVGDLATDSYQDVVIARIPVASLQDAMNIDNKFKAYAAEAEARATWHKRILLVADDEPKFEAVQTQIQDIIPHYYLVDGDANICVTDKPACRQNALRIDTRDFPPTDDPTMNEVSQTIISRVNSGVVLVNYVGHGDVGAWGRWDKDDNNPDVVENKYILHADDLSTLTPGRPMPFVSVGNCLNGAFAGPSNRSAFAEEWLRPTDKGAIGVWAPSGLGYPSGHEKLLTGFYEQLFISEPKKSVGSATQSALNNLYASNSFWVELVNMYILFGDPALELAIHNPPYIRELRMTDVDDGTLFSINVTDDITDTLPLDTSISVTLSRNITAIVEISTAGEMVTTPLLDPNTQYRVGIDAVESLYLPARDDIGGEPLYTKEATAHPRSYTFVTMDSKTPTVTLNGQNGYIFALTDTALELRFSESMRPVQNLYDVNTKLDPPAAVSLNWTKRPANTSARGIDTAGLEAESGLQRFIPYHLEIGENAFRNIAGSPVEPVDFRFEIIDPSNFVYLPIFAR